MTTIDYHSCALLAFDFVLAVVGNVAILGAFSIVGWVIDVVFRGVWRCLGSFKESSEETIEEQDVTSEILKRLDTIESTVLANRRISNAEMLTSTERVEHTVLENRRISNTEMLEMVGRIVVRIGAIESTVSEAAERVVERLNAIENALDDGNGINDEILDRQGAIVAELAALNETLGGRSTEPESLRTLTEDETLLETIINATKKNGADGKSGNLKFYDVHEGKMYTRRWLEHLEGEWSCYQWEGGRGDPRLSGVIRICGHTGSSELKKHLKRLRLTEAHRVTSEPEPVKPPTPAKKAPKTLPSRRKPDSEPEVDE